MSESRNLIDFEDAIRLDSLALKEALTLKKSKEVIYVVGEGISRYLDTLRQYGFRDLWSEIYDVEDSTVVRLYRLLNREKGSEKSNTKNTLLVYAYVDYVLLHTQFDLMVFLPQKSGILAQEEHLSGPTYDEIIRVLEHFPEHWGRIHFVTGLFDLHPKELETILLES